MKHQKAHIDDEKHPPKHYFNTPFDYFKPSYHEKEPMMLGSPCFILQLYENAYVPNSRHF